MSMGFHGVVLKHAAGISLTVNGDWEHSNDPADGVAILSLAPPTDSGFRASHVVTADRLPAEMDFRSWQLGSEVLLAKTLHDYTLIDLEHADHAGLPGLRRLAHYAAKGPHAVVMLQTVILTHRKGYTLTSTVPTMAYPAMRQELEDVARSLRVDDTGGAT